MKKKTKIDASGKRKAKAWGITIGIHLILLLIFVLWKYDFPSFAVNEELPIELALGTDMDGLGEDPDKIMDDPAEMEASSAQAPKSEQASQEYIDASEDPDVPNPVKVPKTTPTPKPIEKNNNTPTTKNKTNDNKSTNVEQSGPKQTGKYVMAGGSGPGGNSADENKSGTGSGNTTGTGTKGTPGGTGSVYATANLKDRRIVRTPSPTAVYNEGGEVVIRVTVNRNGDIVRTDVKSASNSTIKRIAEQKVREIKFNASPTALPEQSGDIVFKFSTGKN